MAAFRNLILFIALGIIFLLFFAQYSGVFAKPEIQITEAGPIVAVCENHTGEYSETANILKKLSSKLWEDGIENNKNLAIFFDDPQTTDIQSLRSKVGRIVEPNQLHRLSWIRRNYDVFSFDRQRAAVVTMPYRNALSLYAAVFKVYPMLRQYALEAGVPNNPIIEIHDTEIKDTPDEVIFILPLAETTLTDLR
jgi:hypothetical protein